MPVIYVGVSSILAFVESSATLVKIRTITKTYVTMVVIHLPN